MKIKFGHIKMFCDHCQYEAEYKGIVINVNTVCPNCGENLRQIQ
jgi:hypothetical protein